MDDIRQDLEKIKSRNARVETDKAWETSWTRRIFIALVTYFCAGFYMSIVSLPYAWIGAFVPTLGYILSTLSIPYIRGFWAEKVHKNQNKSVSNQN